MKGHINNLWTSLAISVLGLIVGIDNLIRWTSDNSLNFNLALGIICIILASGWIIFVLLKKRNTN